MRVPCFHGGDPQSCCLPCCAGDSVTPGTQTSIQRPGVAARSVGKWLRTGPGGVESSMEMLLGRGGCRGTAPYRVWGGGWGLGFASTSFIPNITVPCLCPGKQQWGWPRARREGWGRKEARHPMGMSPAAHSEIAWVNQHESCWETGVRTGTAQLVPAVRKWWRKKERERGSGAAYPEENLAAWGGVRVGATVTQSYSSAPAPGGGGCWGRAGAAWLWSRLAVLLEELRVVASHSAALLP